MQKGHVTRAQAPFLVVLSLPVCRVGVNDEFQAKKVLEESEQSLWGPGELPPPSGSSGTPSMFFPNRGSCLPVP